MLPFPGWLQTVIPQRTSLYVECTLDGFVGPNSCDQLHTVMLIGVHYSSVNLVCPWPQNMCLNIVLLTQLSLVELTY